MIILWTIQSSLACFLVVPQTKEFSKYHMKQAAKLPFNYGCSKNCSRAL